MGEDMQGYKKYQPELFTYVDIEKLIPPNHLLRRIEKILELSFIRKLTHTLYCEDNGRPSIDPEIFFRIQVLGYIYGIQSDRQLCDEIQVNIAFRWFSKLTLQDDVPDHSSLTKIRDRLGEKTYEEVFVKIVQQCKKAGLIPGKRILMDATLVQADASVDSLVERDDNDPKKRNLKNWEKHYWKYKTGTQNEIMKSNHTHVSKTDADSSMVGKPGCRGRLFYKGHYSIDAKHRIITDCKVTTGSINDCEVLPERIDYQTKKLGFSIDEVIADKGYGTGPNYEYLRRENIRSYINPLKANWAEEKPGFIYDACKDRYQCSEGHHLYKSSALKKTIVYRMRGGHCTNCPVKLACSASMNNGAATIFRSEYRKYFESIKRRQATIYFKARLHERMWKAEGIFGEAKNNHGLRRARYRGITKVQIQVYMTSIVQNLKRLALSISDFFRDLFFFQKNTDNFIEYAFS